MIAFQKLPAPLEPYADRAVFVLWKLVSRPNGTTKPPFKPDGHYADPADPSTWVTFSVALAAYSKGGFDGIGVVLRDVNIVAFDLDHCRDPQTGELERAARRLIDLAGSYCEITPSGTGLRIIGQGIGPELHRKQPVPGANGMSVETYRACPRFITISGNMLPGSVESLADINLLADDIVAKLDRKKKRNKLNLDDIIKNGEGGHFGGDRSRALWWAINELIRRGCIDDQIVTILLDRNNRLSEHIYDQKRAPEAYARRQIKQARDQQPDGDGGFSFPLLIGTNPAGESRIEGSWPDGLHADHRGGNEITRHPACFQAFCIRCARIKKTAQASPFFSALSCAISVRFLAIDPAQLGFQNRDDFAVILLAPIYWRWDLRIADLKLPI
jgi:hypothetical protein